MYLPFQCEEDALLTTFLEYRVQDRGHSDGGQFNPKSN